MRYGHQAVDSAVIWDEGFTSYPGRPWRYGINQTVLKTQAKRTAERQGVSRVHSSQECLVDRSSDEGMNDISARMQWK